MNHPTVDLDTTVDLTGNLAATVDLTGDLASTVDLSTQRVVVLEATTVLSDSTSGQPAVTELSGEDAACALVYRGKGFEDTTVEHRGTACRNSHGESSVSCAVQEADSADNTERWVRLDDHPDLLAFFPAGVAEPAGGISEAPLFDPSFELSTPISPISVISESGGSVCSMDSLSLSTSQVAEWLTFSLGEQIELQLLEEDFTATEEWVVGVVTHVLDSGYHVEVKEEGWSSVEDETWPHGIHPKYLRKQAVI